MLVLEGWDADDGRVNSRGVSRLFSRCRQGRDGLVNYWGEGSTVWRAMAEPRALVIVSFIKRHSVLDISSQSEQVGEFFHFNSSVSAIVSRVFLRFFALRIDRRVDSGPQVRVLIGQECFTANERGIKSSPGFGVG